MLQAIAQEAGFHSPMSPCHHHFLQIEEQVR
jgi:hypothetical protein